jgi:hypothetical protein
MCTSIPIVYPTFRTQIRISVQSVLVLTRSNFGMVTRRTPCHLWSFCVSGNHQLQNYFQLPTSFSATLSGAPLCLNVAWALIRGPGIGLT